MQNDGNEDDRQNVRQTVQRHARVHQSHEGREVDEMAQFVVEFPEKFTSQKNRLKENDF